MTIKTESDIVMDVMGDPGMSGRRVAMCVLTSEDRAAKLRDAIVKVGGSDTQFLELASGGEGFDSLADAMMPRAVPSSAFVEQARRNVSERVQFLKTYDALTADQVADAVGSQASNRRSLAARWRAEHKIFAVRVRSNTFVYPGFQFDFDERRPRPIIGKILAVLPAGLRDGGWQLALWWDTPSEFLGWNRPAEVLAKDPAAVWAAAKAEAEEWAQADPPFAR